MTDNVSLLGASGLVYCLWGFCLSLYFLIDRFTSITRKLMKITAITILLLIPHSYQANVSYLAHSLGFLLGILAGICVFSIYKNKFRSFESYRYVLDPPQNPAFDELKDDFWKTE